MPETTIRGAARVQQQLQAHWAQVLLARQLTGLESAIPGIDEVPRFVLTREAAHSAYEFLVELNLSGPLTRRCQQWARDLPVL